MKRVGRALIGLGVITILIAIYIAPGRIYTPFSSPFPETILLYLGVIFALLGIGTLLNPLSTFRSYVGITVMSFLLFMFATTISVLVHFRSGEGILRILGFQLSAGLALSPVATGYLLGLRKEIPTTKNTAVRAGIIGLVGWVLSYVLYVIIEPGIGFGHDAASVIFAFFYLPTLAGAVVSGFLIYGLFYQLIESETRSGGDVAQRVG